MFCLCVGRISRTKCKGGEEYFLGLGRDTCGDVFFRIVFLKLPTVYTPDISCF